MATGLDLITDAFVELGAFGPGDSIPAEHSALGLARLNNMLDAFNTEGLMIYTISPVTFALAVSNQSPTIGVSGSPTFSTVRPLKIEQAVIVDTSANPDERHEMEIVDRQAWASRCSDDSGEFPSALFYEPTYPNGTIHLSCVPTVAHNLELWVRTQLTAVVLLTTTLSFPPGYYEVLLYNLALRLAPAFGFEASPLLMKMASDAKAKVKSVNSRIPRLTSDVPMGCRW